MLRRALAAFLSVTVQFAAVCAPVMHRHLDEHDTDHHRGPTLHGHFTGHSSSSGFHTDTEIGDDDAERTIAALLFVAVASESFDAPPLPSATFALAVPRERLVRRAPRVSHGHDPPTIASVAPRAPPACPVLI